MTQAISVNRNKLPKTFYSQDVLTLAKALLGKTLVHNTGREILSGKIVEVEAYDGEIDEAAHTFNGKTDRNEIMFEEGGYLYVYFTYGMHYCANVVAGEEGHGCAVLLRSIEPLNGVETMKQNRFNNQKSFGIKNLTNGPAKLCEALGIERKHNGTDLDNDEIYILDNAPLPESQIISATRVGIKKSKELMWRFYIKDNPFVSKK